MHNMREMIITAGAMRPRQTPRMMSVSCPLRGDHQQILLQIFRGMYFETWKHLEDNGTIRAGTLYRRLRFLPIQVWERMSTRFNGQQRQ